jgi:acyl-coenzyme A thioesterase PaaI-like protein
MTRLHDAGPAESGPADVNVKGNNRVGAGLGERNELDSPESFVGQIPFGFTVAEGGLAMSGDAEVTDMLRSIPSGPPRASVLATIADCMAGIPACIVTAPSLAVTLDIAVRVVADHCGEVIDMTGEIVKRGRSTVAGEVRFIDAHTDDLVAISYVTFMASPRPQDLAPPLSWAMRTTGSMPVAFPDFVGVRVLADGVTEVDLTPFVMQASGSLQGGIVALIGEIAAESLARTPVLDLDIRYLSAVRVGPGRATAALIGPNLARIEVRDIGSDDRLAALIFARMVPVG